MTQTIIEAIKHYTASDLSIQILLAVIVLDYLTGVARSVREVQLGKTEGKNFKEVGLNSTIGINGLIRHGLVIIISYVVIYFSNQTGAHEQATLFITAFTVSYVISIIENWTLAGYMVPPVILKYVSKLSKYVEGEPEENLNGEDVDGKEI